MNVTVCELHSGSERFAADWELLVDHVQQAGSDLVLLPEMICHPWLAASNDVDPAKWAEAVAAHDTWLSRFEELAPASVIGSRPVVINGKHFNQGFAWDAEMGLRTVHTKYYLPNEPGYWEAHWYQRSEEKRFDAFTLNNASEEHPTRVGMMICTDLWFTEHARDYARQGIDLVVCPRATPLNSREKWIAGGQAAAIMAGAYSLSSNHTGPVDETLSMAGTGWIIDPDGQVLGRTSPEKPFLTLNIDLGRAHAAKTSYPRYVLE